MDAEISEDVNASNEKDTDVQVYRIHWISYVAPLLRFSLLAGLIWLVNIEIAHELPLMPMLTLPVILVSLIALIFNFWHKLAFSVLINKRGVWIKSGIFPWNKGVRGANWRDVRDAAFKTGFFSWLFKSYTITIAHRYTQSNELVAHNIANGHLLVRQINERVEQLNLY